MKTQKPKQTGKKELGGRRNNAWRNNI